MPRPPDHKELFNKPPYNRSRETSDLTMTPPFTLEGVVMRVMPLKADMFVLGEFCDRYLNFDTEGQEDLFLPAFPFVFLAIVNYDRIAAPIGNQGWVGQNEVAFSVILEWYKRKGQDWVFHDWASVSPFIFVDSPGSLTTGREVLGWPKILANLTVGLDAWVKHPLANENLLSLSTRVVAKTYTGERRLDKVLLEVDRMASPQLLAFPPDSTSPLNLLNGMSKMVTGSLDLGQTVLDSVVRSPLRGFKSAGSKDFFGQLWQTLSATDPRNPKLINNAINLKQFRDAEEPAVAAYQALVCSQLKLERINGTGLLNENASLRGDTSGGFQIRIHRYDTQPIVESLGLEYNEAHRLEKSDVYTLKPVAPFWLDLDMTCSEGQILRWRTREVNWTTGKEAPARCLEDDKHAFNTTRGSAIEEMTGPFWFPNTTMRVLPLLADQDRLQNLCDAYFGKKFWRVRPFGSYVYMLVTSHETVASESNNLGGGARKHVDFSIPVLIYDEFKSLSQVMLFSPFRYTDSNEAAITGREINGWPSLYAQIESPGSSWLDDSGPAHNRQGLVELRTDVLPALGSGQELQRKLLLEVYSGDVLAYNDDVNQRLMATDWAPQLHAALEKKQKQRDEGGVHLDSLKALSLELLANRRSFREISLKQFRDAEDPSRACLQTIVGTGWRIERIFDMREMDESPTHVAIHHWPSQPIVDQLGLKAKWLDVTGEAPISYCEPIRPFWAKVAIRTELGSDLAWRTTDGSGFEGAVKDTAGWFRASYRKQSGGYMQAEEASQAELEQIAQREKIFALNPPDVGRDLVGLIEKEEKSGEFFGDLGRRQNLRLAALNWQSQQDSVRLTREEAMEAIESVEEPQAAIESILSREWENWGNPLWWQRQRKMEEEKEEAKMRREGDPELKGGEVKAPHIRQKHEFFIRDDSLGGDLSSQFWGKEYGLEREDGAGPPYWIPRKEADEREDVPVKKSSGVAAEAKATAKRQAPVKKSTGKPTRKGPAKPRVTKRKIRKRIPTRRAIK